MKKKRKKRLRTQSNKRKRNTEELNEDLKQKHHRASAARGRKNGKLDPLSSYALEIEVLKAQGKELKNKR